MLPSNPESELGYEYLPEDEIASEAFATILAGIRADDAEVAEDIDLATLQCASGACPI